MRLVEGFESVYALEQLATVRWVLDADAGRHEPDDVVAAVRSWSQRKGRMFPPEHIKVATGLFKTGDGFPSWRSHADAVPRAATALPAHGQRLIVSPGSDGRFGSQAGDHRTPGPVPDHHDPAHVTALLSRSRWSSRRVIVPGLEKLRH